MPRIYGSVNVENVCSLRVQSAIDHVGSFGDIVQVVGSESVEDDFRKKFSNV